MSPRQHRLAAPRRQPRPAVGGTLPGTTAREQPGGGAEGSRAPAPMGPVLHATLLVAAGEGRGVKLSADDCREVLAALAFTQTARASTLESALRTVQALVVANADALGERSSVPGPTLQGLALQVQALAREALR